MLDVYILPAGMQHSNYQATAKSFENLPFEIKIKKAKRLADVANGERTNPFYSFFFDVEKIDSGLTHNLNVFLKLNKYDVLVLYKKNTRTGHAEFRPRIFKSNVILNPSSMIPIVSIGLETEDVLNGWILEHGYESIHKVQRGRLHQVVASGNKVSNPGRS